MDVTGQAAIVTGGASGLGEATARALAAAGARVAIFDLDGERGPSIAAEIGGCFVRADVADEASLDAGFAAARAAHGQERVLVNCAGIAITEKTASRDAASGAARAHAIASFARIVAINLTGTFACIAKSAAGMLDLEPTGTGGERGVIVATASIAAEDAQAGQAAYAASKGGVKALTLPVARDLMHHGIRVNTILPGVIATPMVTGLPQAVRDALAASIPFPKRLGQPEEYAVTVLFLISNGYMNGATLRLDGALRLVGG